MRDDAGRRAANKPARAAYPLQSSSLRSGHSRDAALRPASAIYLTRRSATMREFHSPSGRRWIARLFYFPTTGTGLGVPATSGSVLRFESENVTLDLADWPNDWLHANDAELVALLRRATTPDFPPRSYVTPLATPAQPPVSRQIGS